MNNEKGMGLVEVLISLVIALIISLALMQTALVSIESNMKNVLRDEAVSVAEARMADARGLPFTSSDLTTLASDTSDTGLTSTICSNDFTNKFGTIGVLVPRKLKNDYTVNFCTNRTVTNLDSSTSPTSKRIDISVYWRWKGETYIHTASSIVRQKELQ